MSMMNASTTFGVVRRPEVADFRDEAEQAMARHVVCTGQPVTQRMPSTNADAMAPHSSNEVVG